MRLELIPTTSPSPFMYGSIDGWRRHLVLPPRAGFFAETEQVSDPVGRIAAEMVSPCPPGVPAVLRRGRFNPAVVDYFRSGSAAGMTIPDASDSELSTFRVVAEP